MLINKTTPVAITGVNDYNTEKLTQIISSHFDTIGITPDTFNNKHVTVKPNLIMKKSPEYAATTSPEILDALLNILDTYTPASVTVAESSGGPYTKQSLEAAYTVCKLKDVALKHGAILNYDTSYAELNFPEGKAVKSFNVITPIAEADVIINLPRLKSHSLTGMSAAVKNYFGVVPGLEKFEFHARFPDYNDFASMLVDLNLLLSSRAETINILDAIVGMEGNGPTGGTPRAIGCVLTSRSAFAIDSIAKELISEGEVLTVKEAHARGLADIDADKINLVGGDYKKFIVRDFKRPDSRKRGMVALLQTFGGGVIGEFFRPRPVIGDKCIGCGECVRSCPQNTITLVENKRGKVASIELDNCIRCFCCQELCPIHTIKVKKRGIVAFVNRAKRKDK
ncbi:MAG: DUF362 domain-containing protein [Clostridia bacterium]|nr:DUF362 domain-containing protein [Clostridia bacterium]